MKIVIASDSYKGSLTSKEVGEVIKSGLTSNPDIEAIVVPIGDGGEGTYNALVDATNGTLVSTKVHSPEGKIVSVSYGISGDGQTAFIEMAQASGLHLSTKLNPITASTFGTGEMIYDAIKSGVKNIIIGIGGSGTNDGGIGMAAALGVKFYSSDGEQVTPDNLGIERLDRIDMSGIDNGVKNIKITAACDVNNPLTGTYGASYVYGPQKGADKEMVERMDKNLAKLGGIIKSDLGIDVDTIPGAGAAGGLGAGLLAFTGATLKSGIDIVLDYLDFDERINGADYVITGEGRMDSQTLNNKAPYGVAQRAGAQNIPVIGICAVFGEGAGDLLDNGFSSIFSGISKLSSLDQSITDMADNLYILSKSITGIILK